MWVSGFSQHLFFLVVYSCNLFPFFPVYDHTSIYSLTLLLTDVCFLFGGVMSKAAVNIPVHVFGAHAHTFILGDKLTGL